MIVKEDGIPPTTHWLLATVLTVHTGKDGRARVVDLKYKGGKMIRPIHKLYILPTTKESDDTL